jgi:hypothetical protein
MRNHIAMNTLVILLCKLGYQEGVDQTECSFHTVEVCDEFGNLNASLYRCSKFNCLA